MIDQRMYRETFSKLCASEEAKREIIERMTTQTKTYKRRPLRTLGLAAAVVAVLCVTAGAVNAATGGELFQRFTIVWAGEDRLRAVDTAGNEVMVTMAGSELVTKEDGRLFLSADGKKIDITEAMERDGGYHYAYEMTVVHEDGSEEIRTVTIDVTGGTDQWTVTQDNGDGTAYTLVGTEDEVEEVDIALGTGTREGPSAGAAAD